MVTRMRASIAQPATLIATCLVLAAFSPALSNAQVLPDSSAAEAIERAIESIDEDAGDTSLLVETLEFLLENPLDVNTATIDELSLVPGIDEGLAFAIVDYRRNRGPFQSLPELQLVPGLTEDVFQDARPYLMIGEELKTRTKRPSPFPSPVPVRELVRGIRLDVIQRVTRRLDTGVGYQDDSTRTTYAGGPERIYSRLRATYGRRLSLNLTGEKDPGEVLDWSPSTGSLGYDHVTGHAAIRDFGRIHTLVVGDYVAAFGQGLVFWKGLSAGKGRDVIGPASRSGNGITPYGSTDENGFLRGVATTIRLTRALSVSGFASRRTLDATVSASDSLQQELEEVNLTNTGLHRTPTEIAKRDALSEALLGGNVEFTAGKFSIGAVAYKSQFDKPLIPGDAAYQRYRFTGRDVGIASAYGSWFISTFRLFGEVARDQDGNVATFGGTSARFGRGIRAVMIARRYPRSFTNLHSFAFGESSGATQNESGVYLGLRVTPARHWVISTYMDQYRFPWIRFGVPMPSSGHETLLLVEHRPRRWLNWYVQARSETKEGGVPVVDDSGQTVDGLRDETRQSVRLNLQYEFSKQLTLRSRVEVTRFSAEKEPTATGTLLLQDLRWNVSPALALDSRLMLFDTDSFDARVFTYEYDLRYSFSIPSFSGRGQRTYLMLSFKPQQNLLLQVKYAVTRYENVETVGSGLDEVAGNRLREIRAQLLWRI